MTRVNRLKHRQRSSSRGRLVLFLAGGLATLILLVVVLISLEQHSPVQSALPEPSAGREPDRTAVRSKPSAPILDQPPTTTPPETFTFYDTLEQKNSPAPGFTEKTSRPAPRSVPSVTPSSGPSGASLKKQAARYTIQIAAIKDRPTAEALTDRLKRKGYPVFILPHVVPKRGTWYRVRVGHFAKREAAEEMAQQISGQERLRTYIAKE